MNCRTGSNGTPSFTMILWIGSLKKKPKRTNQTLQLPSKAHGKVNEIIFIWASVNRALFICCCNTCPFKFYLSGVQLVSKTEKWTDEIRVYWQIGIVISSEALKDILICEIRKVYFSIEKKKSIWSPFKALFLNIFVKQYLCQYA